MDFRAEYEKWCTDPYFDEATKAELKAIAGDDKEIEDRFYRTLEFGTAGLRGVIGAGTNRMNIYTVRQATQGLANYILSQGEDAVKRGVAIAHDSRNMHDEFTDEAAVRVELVQTSVKHIQQILVLHHRLDGWSIILNIVEPAFLVAVLV